MNLYFDKDKRGRDLLIAEDAEIISNFSNFRGLPSRYNAEGNRNFCLVIPEDMVDGMLHDGWNVKATRPKNEEYQPQHYIQVNISWAKFPPSVRFITSRGETEIDESVIGQLDTAEIERMDMAISLSYRTKDDGSTGIKGYVRTMDVVLYEDPIRRARRARETNELPFEE